jgi:hypothetical protein
VESKCKEVTLARVLMRSVLYTLKLTSYTTPKEKWHTHQHKPYYAAITKNLKISVAGDNEVHLLVRFHVHCRLTVFCSWKTIRTQTHRSFMSTWYSIAKNTKQTRNQAVAPKVPAESDSK